MGHILWVEPVFKEMIWGGNQLKEKYGYAIPSDQTGECWAPSAHPNGDNKIKEGEFKGQTLSKVFDEHRELFGNIKDKQFPLLVKIIDACNDLSVQVHPNDEYADLHENSLGKTECWYVLDCKEDTKMVMGHHAKTKEELVKAIENDDYDHLLNKFDIKKGDFFYIPSGTIHAICKGSYILVTTSRNTKKVSTSISPLMRSALPTSATVPIPNFNIICAEHTKAAFENSRTIECFSMSLIFISRPFI